MKSRRKKFVTMNGAKKKPTVGKRFATLKATLTRKGVRNPAAMAASMGRKKY